MPSRASGWGRTKSDQGCEPAAFRGSRSGVVQAHRRAAAPDNAAQIVRRGALSIDGEKMQTTWNGTPVTLSLTEFWIVHALARNPGHVKNRQQLMDAANVVLDDNTITSHIKRVRRKFQQIDAAFDAIQTVYGMGYRWVE